MKKLKEELTEKMHSEFQVDEQTDLKLKVGSMWEVAGFDCTHETLLHWCKAYGIAEEQALRWKGYWQNLS